MTSATQLAEERSFREIVPATSPRESSAKRLLLVDPRLRVHSDHRAGELAALLLPGDVVVVNDAATLPASLGLAHEDVEIRLVQRLGSRTFRGLAFGAGDHRTPTELRPLPRPFTPGERLDLGRLVAVVEGVDSTSPRLLRLRFDGDAAKVALGLYARGRPIQYAHVTSDLELWDVQGPFASRPWAFEAPSAGFLLSFATVDRLRARGVEVVPLTHAAGISSTGSTSLDRSLPLDEHYDLPPSTVEAIERARARGGRIVAIGTTVVRSLESSAATFGELRPGTGVAKLRLGRAHRLRVVHGILTGIHTSETSHYQLLESFADRELLDRVLEHATRSGYLGHEFGDGCLILPSSITGVGRRSAGEAA